MDMNTQERIEIIERHLSALIISNLCGASHEQYFPCSNPDEMDERIKEGKERAAALRVLRVEFENIVTGYYENAKARISRNA